jgi:hypothetical protein
LTPVTDVGRDALVAGDVDEARDEAAVTVAVHGRRQADDGGAHPAVRHGEHRELRPDPRGGGQFRAGHDVLGAEPPRRDHRDHERPRRDHEGLAGSGQDVTHRLDGVQVGRARRGEVTEVMLEGQVDDPVRVGRACAEAVGVVEGAAAHPRSHRGQGVGRGVGPGEAGDLVPGLDELGNDGGPDPAGCSGNEDVHVPNLPCEDLMSVAVVSLASDVSFCHHG